MPLVSLRSALTGGPAPTGSPPSPRPPGLVPLRSALTGAPSPPSAPAAPAPASPRPGPSEVGDALRSGAGALSAYNGLTRMFGGEQIPHANWLGTLLNIGAAGANDPDHVRGIGRGVVGAIPNIVRGLANMQFGAAPGMLANSAALNWANLGLSAAGFGLNALGDRRASAAFNTLSAPVTSALGAMSSAYGGPAAFGSFFLGPLTESLFGQREPPLLAAIASHPAFNENDRTMRELRREHPGANSAWLHGERAAHLGSLGPLATLRRGAINRTPGVDPLYAKARAWTLADVVGNGFTTMMPNRYGESHEYAFGTPHEIPVALRTPTAVNAMLDNELDLMDSNWGAIGGEGANSGGYHGALTPAQLASIQRYGTLSNPGNIVKPFENDYGV